jgi:hypothetical protein
MSYYNLLKMRGCPEILFFTSIDLTTLYKAGKNEGRGVLP